MDLQDDVANLRRYLDYMKSIEFNELMKTGEDQDAFVGALMDDATTTNTNVECDKDLTTT